MSRYLIVIDTPGIKQFVFGTDALAEVRGASALLDRLNRLETEKCLRDGLGSGLSKVFANGGTGQFVVDAPDLQSVRQALDRLSTCYRDQTGGEVRPIAAVAHWVESMDYKATVRAAIAELHMRRDLASAHPTVATLPLAQECASASHLPAVGPFSWGGERLLLSAASRLKRQESLKSPHGSLWSGWIEHLDLPLEIGHELRPTDAETIGACSRRNGYVGLVYADGNAMGRLVQNLSGPNECRAFSELVDGNIRQACYEALTQICSSEIAEAREDLANGKRPGPLPADILLLGGDDLLVLLPMDRALNFAIAVTETFQRLTWDDQVQGAARDYLNSRLSGRGLTVSCGVALAPARYPFYLLLDLAEELLRSAKRGGSLDAETTKYWAPAYVDFHLVAGSANQELAVIREEDYLVNKARPRTLRPYRLDELQRLREATKRLQQARLPRSKLHDLFAAALDPREPQATFRAQEVFGRLRNDEDHAERRALWDALSTIGRLDIYPWTLHNGRKVTALPDLIEAHDLFSQPEEA
jgi:CRISPR-associated protein Cmr2